MIDLLDHTSADMARRPSGLWVPGSLAEMPIGSRRPIAVDLFCGCGGMSLGFLQAGWEIVAAVDWEPIALITYMVNLGSYPINLHFIEPGDWDRMERELHPMMSPKGSGLQVVPTSGSARPKDVDWPPVRNVWCGDIRKLKDKDILDILGLMPGEIDCVCGGPPCQGFSRMGKRNVMDPRNSLVFEFGRLVLELMPKTMIMENVPDIVSMVTPEGLPVLDELTLMLERGGYGTREALKRSLLATSGTGAAIKGKPVARRKGPKHGESGERQRGLFDGQDGGDGEDLESVEGEE